MLRVRVETCKTFTAAVAPSYFAGVSVESLNALGQTPLFVAAYTRDTEMVRLLLDAGADPNGRCTGGYTAVHGACFAGSARILRWLLEHGGDLELHDCWRQTPT